MAWVAGHFCRKLVDALFYDAPLTCAFMSSEIQNHSMKQIVINHFHIHGDYIAGDGIDIHDNPSSTFCQGQPFKTTSCSSDTFEDVSPIDTSFFCTNRFTSDIIEKNLRHAIESASSKADACRRIMALDTQGYILISNVGDDCKAKLINPFAAPKFTFCGDDFTKARNRRTKQ